MYKVWFLPWTVTNLYVWVFHDVFCYHRWRRWNYGRNIRSPSRPSSQAQRQATCELPHPHSSAWVHTYVKWPHSGFRIRIFKCPSFTGHTLSNLSGHFMDFVLIYNDIISLCNFLLAGHFKLTAFGSHYDVHYKPSMRVHDCANYFEIRQHRIDLFTITRQKDCFWAKCSTFFFCLCGKLFYFPMIKYNCYRGEICFMSFRFIFPCSTTSRGVFGPQTGTYIRTAVG